MVLWVEETEKPTGESPEQRRLYVGGQSGRRIQCQGTLLRTWPESSPSRWPVQRSRCLWVEPLAHGL